MARDRYYDLDKIINEDLKGIATSEDIRFIIQNRLESRKIEFADFATVIISVFALLVAFASLDYVASRSLLVPIITVVIVVIVIFLVFRNFRRLEAEYLSTLDEYIELRKKQTAS